VFEVCRTYADARRMLETIPIARPAIYTLVGCLRGERCVIERTEDGALTREDETSAANDWVPNRANWEGRINANQFVSSSFAQAADKSRARREALAGWTGSLCDRGFDWVRPPVLNPYTRLAVAMSPAHGILRVVGYETVDSGLPQPATQVCEVEAKWAA
jgi:hypothetical protein